MVLTAATFSICFQAYMGPIIGRAADRWGRNWLLPIGFGVAGVSAIILIFDVPLVIAALAVTSLSLGYDMTQPLLSGIITALSEKRQGQAMGLNAFTLFAGFGTGSFLFGKALELGFSLALAVFASSILVAALGGILLFRFETSNIER